MISSSSVAVRRALFWPPDYRRYRTGRSCSWRPVAMRRKSPMCRCCRYICIKAKWIGSIGESMCGENSRLYIFKNYTCVKIKCNGIERSCYSICVVIIVLFQFSIFVSIFLILPTLNSFKYIYKCLLPYFTWWNVKYFSTILLGQIVGLSSGRACPLLSPLFFFLASSSRWRCHFSKVGNEFCPYANPHRWVVVISIRNRPNRQLNLNGLRVQTTQDDDHDDDDMMVPKAGFV